MTVSIRLNFILWMFFISFFSVQAFSQGWFCGDPKLADPQVVVYLSNLKTSPDQRDLNAPYVTSVDRMEVQWGKTEKCANGYVGGGGAWKNYYRWIPVSTNASIGGAPIYSYSQIITYNPQCSLSGGQDPMYNKRLNYIQIQWADKLYFVSFPTIYDYRLYNETKLPDAKTLIKFGYSVSSSPTNITWVPCVNFLRQWYKDFQRY